ncbi:MAG: alkaline phosphatase family protein, partial [Planctomycetes bacterium]|nr:alkaline phosphatase family protein [Planctomycetota bacterium]
VLLRVLQGRGRVASLSIKERAAILMAALRAQICYWFNPANGRFGASPYYRDDPHSWVNAFNKKKVADQWLDKTWDRFRPDLDYVKHSGPDDFISEGTGYLQGRTFPHPFKLADTDDPKENVQNYYDAVTNSPMGNELLLEFAKAAIVAEKLGQTDSTDLLFISFTSNDYVGHTWGPDSQEVLDVTLRSDALMKDLLGFLDAKVGKGKYYLAMSADHGVCPLPEFAEKEGKTTGRVDPLLLTSKAEEFLNKKFLKDGEKAPWLEELKRSTAWIYLNRETIKELKLKQEDVEIALARWYDEQPGVAKAFTRTEMMREDTKEPSKLMQQMRLSFHADSSGDVMVVLKPYHIFSPPNIAATPKKYPTYRATHGTPYEYDTHVPLLVLGPRIEPGVREQRVAPQAMASILAEALGVPRPKDAAYPLPAGLFRR